MFHFLNCKAVSHDFGEVFNVTVTPHPLRRGQKINANADISTCISKLCIINDHNSFPEREIQWGIFHFKMTHNFKNYTNITFFDGKFNLCDFCADVINANCPLQPGKYFFNYSGTLPNLFGQSATITLHKNNYYYFHLIGPILYNQ